MQGAQHGTVSRRAVGCSLYMYIQAASKHALGSIVCVLPPPRKLSHSTFEGLLSLLLLLLLLLAILLLQTPRTPLTLWREMVHPLAPAKCNPVRSYMAGSKRREVTVPATWLALALGAGQGPGLLLLLLLQEHTLQDASSRSSPHSSSSLEAPLML